MSDLPASWQEDPTGKHDHRYWDGTRWTDNVADAGVASIDPFDEADLVAAHEPEPEPEPEPDVTALPVPQTPEITAILPTERIDADVSDYVPPTPAPDDIGGGGRRRFATWGAALVVVALVVGAFLVLGDDDDGPDPRTALAAKIRQLYQVDAKGSECAAAFLVEKEGEQKFADGIPDSEVEAAVTGARAEIAEACSVEQTALGGQDAPTTDDEDLQQLSDACAAGEFRACDDLFYSAVEGSELFLFGSTCGGIAPPQEGGCEATDGGAEVDVGDLPQELLDEILGDVEGLSNEQRRCLEEQLAEAVREGALEGEPDASVLISILVACDIDIEELAPRD